MQHLTLPFFCPVSLPASLELHQEFPIHFFFLHQRQIFQVTTLSSVCVIMLMKYIYIYSLINLIKLVLSYSVYVILHAYTYIFRILLYRRLSHVHWIDVASVIDCMYTTKSDLTISLNPQIETCYSYISNIQGGPGGTCNILRY